MIILVRELRAMTARNDHGGAYLLAAQKLGLDALALKLQGINQRHRELGYLPPDLYHDRHMAYEELIRSARKMLRDSDYELFYSSF